MTYEQYRRARADLQASWEGADEGSDDTGARAALADMRELADAHPDHAARWSRELVASSFRMPTTRRGGRS